MLVASDSQWIAMKRGVTWLVKDMLFFWTICRCLTVHGGSPARRLLQARYNHLYEELCSVLSQNLIFLMLCRAKWHEWQMQHALWKLGGHESRCQQTLLCWRDWGRAELDTNVVLSRVTDWDHQEFSLKELKVKLKVTFHHPYWDITEAVRVSYW